jgi:integrase/recombinase XerD
MRVQRVTAPDGGTESWTVVDEAFAVVDPVDEFLAHLTVIERSPGTVRSYAFDLRDYFEFLSAHGIDWRTVRLEHLGRFVGWLRLAPATRASAVTALVIDEPHCSAVTINRKLSAVGSFYTFHHRHGVDCGELLTTIKSGGASGSWRPFLAHLGSDGNKRRRTIKLKTPQHIPRTLSPESVAAVVNACDRLRDRFLIELLAGTGMRIGEALGLRHEDIDAARSLIRIRRRINSNGARVKGVNRDIPVSAELIRLYTDYLVEEYGDLDCDYVFVNLWGGTRGMPLRYWNVTELVDRLRTRSGVKFTVHMLRHTYATDLLRRGVPAEVVQKLLGHVSLTTTTTTYAHLEIEDLRQVLRDKGCLDDSPGQQ